MPVTQKDVAARAGVTRSVVSHVMHGSGGTIRCTPETADRVRKVAEEMGYQPNALARNFRRQRTGQIGLLHGEGFGIMRFDSDSRYFAALMDGIVAGAFNNHYILGLCPDLLSDSPDQAMVDRRFDGFVWYSTFHSPKNEERLKRCTAPIVLIHSKAETFDNQFPTVICDNEQGIRLALEHLADLGHRRIAFAYDEGVSFSESKMRRDAFFRVGMEMGLDLGLLNVQSSATSITEYIERGPCETALIAHGEVYASRVIKAAHAHGIRVPEDFSVVGFDSTLFCDYQNPPLTCISQPLAKMGELAVDILAQLIDGRQPERLENLVPCGLDIRSSTGPAPV